MTRDGGRRATLSFAGGNAVIAISPATIFICTANPVPGQAIAPTALYDRFTPMIVPQPDMDAMRRQLLMGTMSCLPVRSAVPKIEVAGRGGVDRDRQEMDDIIARAAARKGKSEADVILGDIDDPDEQRKVLSVADTIHRSTVNAFLQNVMSINAQLADVLDPSKQIGFRTIADGVSFIVSGYGIMVRDMLVGAMVGMGLAYDEAERMVAVRDASTAAALGL